MTNNQRNIVVVLFLTFITYTPALFAQFTDWDDQAHILENILVLQLDPHHLWRIFNSALNLTYIPLTILTFAIEHSIFGFNPFIYHLDNLILHLGVVGLIYLFCLRLKINSSTAALAALLFGIHPMHVESVAWVTERKDVLYSMFYMLALLAYLDFLKQNTSRYYLLTLAWGTLSLLSKPMALSLPLILLLLDWLLGRREWRRMLIEKIPFFLVVIPIAGITYFLNTKILIPDKNVLQGSLIFVWSFVFYIQQFIFPKILVPYYSLPIPVSVLNPVYATANFVFLLLIYSLIRFRKNRWFIFSFCFYFFSIFFLLRFSMFHAKGITSDRFMYLPSLGFCILFALGYQRLSEYLDQGAVWKKMTLHVGAFLLIAGLIVKTFLQCGIWHDSITFWNYVIDHSETVSYFYENRGNAYQLKYDDQHALADYDKALRINPLFDVVLYNRACLYLSTGEYHKALADFNRSIQIYPYSADAYNNRALVYRQLGRDDLALADLKRAIALNPRSDTTDLNLGTFMSLQGHYDRALTDFNKAIKYNPSLTSAYLGRGYAYMKLGKNDLALDDFNRALAITPAYMAYVDSAIIYRMRNQNDMAYKALNKALLLNTSDPAVYLQRGVLYVLEGNYLFAVADFSKAIALDPKNDLAYNGRAAAYAGINKFKEALQDLLKAQSLGYPINRDFLLELQGKVSK